MPVLWPWQGARYHRATRQRESVWPEENRGKCFGTAVLAGGGAEGRGSRRFSGAPYGFALARWRAQAERVARGIGVRGRPSLVPGRCLLVRRSTHVGRGVTLVGAMREACSCEGRRSLV